jgi:hypothetical protein
MACVRSAIWSLVKMLEMWLRTVLGLTNKSLAILALLWLWAMRSSTSPTPEEAVETLQRELQQIIERG